MANDAQVEIVERDEVSVMFKRVPDDQSEITRGWAELEEAIGSLRGRRFYGVFYERPAPTAAPSTTCAFRCATTMTRPGSASK
jgi:hypothetical protein